MLRSPETNMAYLHPNIEDGEVCSVHVQLICLHTKLEPGSPVGPSQVMLGAFPPLDFCCFPGGLLVDVYKAHELFREKIIV